MAHVIAILTSGPARAIYEALQGLWALMITWVVFSLLRREGRHITEHHRDLARRYPLMAQHCYICKGPCIYA